MNKKALVIAGGIVLAIVAAVGYVLVVSPTPEPKQAATTSATAPPAVSPQPSAGAGTYIDYTPDVIGATSGTKLLFFHAPWCPQCRELEADIKAKTIPAGVTIIKVDYDSNQALRQKYGVTLQTTVVRVDDSGNILEKFVAYDDPSLDAVVKQLL